jgi:lysozyme
MRVRPLRLDPEGREGSVKISAAGLDLIKQSEGFRSRVYLDVAGIPTIGYGHRLLHPESFPNGISESAAQHILECDIRDAEAAVMRLVTVLLTQGQFDALVDFTFNLGGGRLASSTLLKVLNAGDYEGAAAQLLRWDMAAGHENSGLKARRTAEVALWCGTAGNGAETENGPA